MIYWVSRLLEMVAAPFFITTTKRNPAIMRRKDSLQVLCQLDYLRLNRIDAQQKRINRCIDMAKSIRHWLNLPHHFKTTLCYMGCSQNNAKNTTLVTALFMAGLTVHPIAIMYALVAFNQMFNN